MHLGKPNNFKPVLLLLPLMLDQGAAGWPLFQHGWPLPTTLTAQDMCSLPEQRGTKVHFLSPVPSPQVPWTSCCTGLEGSILVTCTQLELQADEASMNTWPLKGCQPSPSANSAFWQPLKHQCWLHAWASASCGHWE